MDRSSDWLKQAQRDLEKAKLDLDHEFYKNSSRGIGCCK